MRIGEAIKVNKETKLYLEEGSQPLSAKALQLSIEALKREAKRRKLYPWHKFELLPGETEDNEEEEPDVEEGEEVEELAPEELERRFPHLFRDSRLGGFYDFEDRAFILSKLVSRYPDEVVSLINAGQMNIPQWIIKELEEKKVRG